MEHRRVERKHIDEWIESNGPDGMSRLAVKSGVSSSTIGNTRRGIVPKRKRTRLALCRALNMAEHELFPPANGEAEAS